MCTVLFIIWTDSWYIQTFAVCIKAFSLNGCRPIKTEVIWYFEELKVIQKVQVYNGLAGEQMWFSPVAPPAELIM